MIIIASGFALGQGLEDGPYLIKKGDDIKVLNISNGVLKTSKLAKGDLVKVSFKSHPDWDYSFPLHKVKDEKSSFSGSAKLLAVSDIEGEFSAFRDLMLANGVIDKQSNWAFGRGHLVICGDLFDRGRDVMPYIWLLYKLEWEAKKAGGYVHVILGNHDTMNLSGDFRYLDKKYLASSTLIGIEYLEVLKAGSLLGDWLRSKNVVEKIGDQLFLHAGLSDEVLKLNLSLDEINRLCRQAYGKKKDERSGIEKLLMGQDGPLWYRGYFGPLDVSVIDRTLAQFKVNQLVVGHTIAPANVMGYYGGKVIGIDVDTHEGQRSGFLREKNLLFEVNDMGIKIPLRCQEGFIEEWIFRLSLW